MGKTFYCKKYSNVGNLNIEEWNYRFKKGNEMGLTDIEMNKFLEEDICEIQCEECMNIVLEQQAKTRKLIKNE